MQLLVTIVGLSRARDLRNFLEDAGAPWLSIIIINNQNGKYDLYVPQARGEPNAVNWLASKRWEQLHAAVAAWKALNGD